MSGVYFVYVIYYIYIVLMIYTYILPSDNAKTYTCFTLISDFHVTCKYNSNTFASAAVILRIMNPSSCRLYTLVSPK